jgi:putative DNA primase/helicase
MSRAEAHRADMERGNDRLLLADKKVMRVPGPGCDCCKDLDEALGKHPIEEIRVAIEAIATKAELSLDGEARRCAKVKDPLKRAEAILRVIEDRELKRRPGMIPAFRKAVDRYAGTRDADSNEDVAGAAEMPVVEDVIPWPHEVDGAEVLDAIVRLMLQHVNMPPEAADAVALWTAFSHALELFWFNPRLALCSPVKRCGKTTLIEVLSHLVPRAKPTSNVTASVVFRLIDLYCPTYLIDETDTYLPNNEELRAALNSGHTRTSAFVDRNIKSADGEWTPKSFSTWCPQVVAGIGNLPGTLDDRSIKIRLQRKPRGIRLVRFRADRVTGINDLGRMLARFVLDHQIAIREADVEPPTELHDRAADNWRPLLAIASVLNNEWLARAVAAAKTLEAVDTDAEDLCVQALDDIRAVFIRKNKQAEQYILENDAAQANTLRLFTKEILAALLALPERPWRECNQGRAITQRGLAKLIKVFGVKTDKNVRRGTGQAKGYALDEFLEAFARYLPPLKRRNTRPSVPAQRNQ